MASYSRLILQVAATIGMMAAVLASASPVMAAESAIAASQTVAANANAAPSVGKRRAAPAIRIATSRYDRRIGGIRSDLGCSGAWCGRQFVLMVGVAYWDFHC
jgi:hypothetical protein